MCAHHSPFNKEQRPATHWPTLGYGGKEGKREGGMDGFIRSRGGGGGEEETVYRSQAAEEEEGLNGQITVIRVVEDRDERE